MGWVSGDALYTQGSLFERIVEAGGDYLFIVKGNQGRLYEGWPCFLPSHRLGRGSAKLSWREGRGIGGKWAVGALGGLGRICGLAGRQAGKVGREVERKGQRRVEVRYAINGAGPGVGAEGLPCLVRGHWAIENRLPWVWDVRLGEEASQVRSGSGAEVMAVLRKVVLSLLRQAEVKKIEAALRQKGWQQALPPGYWRYQLNENGKTLGNCLKVVAQHGDLPLTYLYGTVSLSKPTKRQPLSPYLSSWEGEQAYWVVK